MKKPKRRVQKNYPLRAELIAKGIITPRHLLATRLKERGYTEAARVVAERVNRGLGLFAR